MNLNFLYPFIALSFLGLLASLIVHFCALFGIESPLGEEPWILGIGIFVVWLPAVLVSQRITKEFERKDFWKAALRGCPVWMKYMTYGFFIYAVVNFFIFFVLTVGSPEKQDIRTVIKGFSGHWMAFYSAALAILYSAVNVAKQDAARKCPNGHAVNQSDEYCKECGMYVGSMVNE